MVYEVAQWFPRMAVYDDIQGWNTLPYLGQGEFYLEYGDIDFTITAPSNLIVVGSGELLNPQECYTAEQMKRWAAAKNSDKTVIIRSDKEVTDKNSRPQTASTPGNLKFRIPGMWPGPLPGLLCRMQQKLIYQVAKNQWPSVYILLKVLQKTDGSVPLNLKGYIEHYSNKWFEFPYPAATNVAGIVGGMEYPGIVFCSSGAAGAGLWGVTDHEFGHTWFPMIVGSNERKYAWMDEGFNTFINDGSTEAFNNGEFNEASFFGDPNSAFMVKITFGEKMDGLIYDS